MSIIKDAYHNVVDVADHVISDCHTEEELIQMVSTQLRNEGLDSAFIRYCLEGIWSERQHYQQSKYGEY